ncbi:MAG: P-II family nitrogen regulator [Kiritimatiellae bacterium]|nr:P-II family nitrogen regulator [Kiritimatiellia bacterium]
MAENEKSKALKLILAIVQRGRADDLVKAAIRAGAPAATVWHGRGQGIRERLGLLGLAIQPEKEVVLTVVEEWLLDAVVAAMVKEGKLDQPGIGIIFVLPVERAVGMVATAEQGSAAASSG